MPTFDELRIDAVKRAVQTHKTVDAAHEAACKEIQKLPGYAEWKADLAERTILEEVYDVRAAFNRAGKQQVRNRQNEPRGNPPGKQVAVDNLLTLNTYRIGGTVLGLLTGAQLRGLIDAEKARAKGHMDNVLVMEALSPHVGEDEIVNNKIKEKFFQQVLRNVFGAEKQAAAG